MPFDDQSPFVTSGVRLGTPAMSTRGMKEDEMREIAALIDDVLLHVDDAGVQEKVKGNVRELCRRFPLYEFQLN